MWNTNEPLRFQCCLPRWLASATSASVRRLARDRAATASGSGGGSGLVLESSSTTSDFTATHHHCLYHQGTTPAWPNQLQHASHWPSTKQGEPATAADAWLQLGRQSKEGLRLQQMPGLSWTDNWTAPCSAAWDMFIVIVITIREPTCDDFSINTQSGPKSSVCSIWLGGELNSTMLCSPGHVHCHRHYHQGAYPPWLQHEHTEPMTCSLSLSLPSGNSPAMTSAWTHRGAPRAVSAAGACMAGHTAEQQHLQPHKVYIIIIIIIRERPRHLNFK